MTQIGIGASIVIQQELGTALFSPSWDNTPIVSADNEETNPSDLIYVKVKEIKALISGTFRIKFIMHSGGGFTSYAKIYKNGSAYGIEHTTTNSTYDPPITEDLQFNANDLIQLYIKNTNSYNTVYVMNFRLYGSPYGQFIINLN